MAIALKGGQRAHEELFAASTAVSVAGTVLADKAVWRQGRRLLLTGVEAQPRWRGLGTGTKDTGGQLGALSCLAGRLGELAGWSLAS